MKRGVTGIIILAGGSSSRMGRPKQLLVYQDKTLLRHAAEMAIELNCGTVIVVTGALHQELVDTCNALATTFVHNPLWQEGMATSIVSGLQALEAMHPDKIDAVLLMLCDQPLITVTHLQQLLNVFKESAGIVATAYADVAGVPAVFGRELFGELYELIGDKGARALFAKHQHKLRMVAFEGAAVDVDTMIDFEGLGGVGS